MTGANCAEMMMMMLMMITTTMDIVVPGHHSKSLAFSNPGINLGLEPHSLPASFFLEILKSGQCRVETTTPPVY
jgi:hypothetical protein